MKKILAIVLTVVMMACLCSCADKSADKISAGVDTSKTGAEFDSYNIDGIDYLIPAGWSAPEDFSSTGDGKCIAYANEDVNNIIVILSYTNLSNDVEDDSDVQRYFDSFKIGEGWDKKDEFSEYLSLNVPAMRTGFVCRDGDDDYAYLIYAFVVNPSQVFMIYHVYLPSSEHTYTDEFDTIISSLEFEDFKYGKAESGASSTVNFTNKYGTATTKCAHPGCDNYIASSGDTNCCTTHSKKCLNCGCYIDEDAMYCMDCISNAASNQ